MPFGSPIGKPGSGGGFGRKPARAETVETLQRDLETLDSTIESVRVRGITQSSMDTSQAFVERYRAQGDFDFLMVIYFVTREQRDAFAGSLDDVTMDPAPFVNGTALARKLGVELPPAPNLKDPAKRANRWRKFARTPTSSSPASPDPPRDS